MCGMELDEIIDSVNELYLDSDEVFDACICLLVAESINSTNPVKLSKLTGVDIDTVRDFCRNWRRGGIFKRGKIIKSPGWADDDEDLGFAFVLDACVAVGLTKRIRME